MTDTRIAVPEVTERRKLRLGISEHAPSNGGQLPDTGISSGPGTPGVTVGGRQAARSRDVQRDVRITGGQLTVKLPIPASGNRGRESSEVELGLHDPRFLPLGDVGIGQPDPAGRLCQLASMKWVFFVGPGRSGRGSRRPEGRTCIGRLEGCPNNSKKENGQ